jgi:hypothetical protein
LHASDSSNLVSCPPEDRNRLEPTSVLAPLPRWLVVQTFLVAGLALLIAQVQAPYTVRVYDHGGHFSYIERIRTNHAIPAAEDCWECHQPPAYYALAAGLLLATRTATPPESPEQFTVYPGARVLKTLEVAIGFGTLAFWLLTIQLVLASTYERVVASTFCTFWPTFALHACRISNDSLFYLFTAACVWQLVSWRRTRRARSLVAAAVAAGLAMNVKINGLVTISIVLASLAAAVVFARADRPRWPRGGVPALLAIAALVGVWALGVHHWKHGTISLNFHMMGDNHRVRNLPADFVTVSAGSFADTPWVAVVGDSPGRSEFWNYLFRSSLFGEFGTSDRTVKAFAYLLVGLAALFIPFVVFGFCQAVARGFRRGDVADVGLRELAFTLLGFLSFSVVLRYRYPWAPHNDFRFVLPIVLPCAVMAAMSFRWLMRTCGRRFPHVATLPGHLLAVFCFASGWILLAWK